MRDSKETKLIKVGDINPGHNKYDASSVYSIGGVDNSDTPTMNKGYPLR